MRAGRLGEQQAGQGEEPRAPPRPQGVLLPERSQVSSECQTDRSMLFTTISLLSSCKQAIHFPTGKRFGPCWGESG